MEEVARRRVAARIRRRGKTRLAEGTYTRFLKVEFPRVGKRDGARESGERKKENGEREREEEGEREGGRERVKARRGKTDGGRRTKLAGRWRWRRRKERIAGGGGGGEGGEVEGRREIKMAARASGAEPPTRTTLLLAVIKGKRGEN